MIDHLTSALCDLRDSLRRGDLQSLEMLSLQIEALLDKLVEEGAPPEQLAQLRQTAGEMEDILQAAYKGLVTARRRLTEIEEVRAGLTTYSAEGTRVVAHHSQGPVHRI